MAIGFSDAEVSLKTPPYLVRQFLFKRDSGVQTVVFACGGDTANQRPCYQHVHFTGVGAPESVVVRG